MKYYVDEYECNLIIEKKNNKNTYIKVKENNTILVTTNYFVTKKQVIELLEKNKEFLLKSLKKIEKKEQRDSKFYLLGKEYNVIIMDTKIEIIGNNIYVPSTKKLDSWLTKQMKDLYQKRLDYYYNMFEENIPYPNVRIRKMKTRWGVCNRRTNTVTLNTELIKYDITKLDYVIVHELSHFVHFNHSKAFWNLVSKYCKDYKKIRKELKD